MRIMIVDDDPEVVELLTDAMRRGGHQPTSFSSGGLALGAIVRGKFEVVLLDLKLPNLGGTELIAIIRDQFPFLPVIVISGLDPEVWQPKAMKAGASTFLSKPIRLEEVLEEVAWVERAQHRLHIGVIDDDPNLDSAVSRDLHRLGCRVTCWPTVFDMLRASESDKEQLSTLLVAVEVAGFDDAMIWAGSRNIATVAVRDDSPANDEALLRAGAAFCLSRPVDAEALVVQARFFIASTRPDGAAS